MPDETPWDTSEAVALRCPKCAQIRAAKVADLPKFRDGIGFLTFHIPCNLGTWDAPETVFATGGYSFMLTFSDK